MSGIWFPTGMGEPSRPLNHDDLHEAPGWGMLDTFGPSAQYPFGDYPSWYVRKRDCELCREEWSDWGWAD